MTPTNEPTTKQKSAAEYALASDRNISMFKGLLSDAGYKEVSRIAHLAEGEKGYGANIALLDRVIRAVVIDLDTADGKVDGKIQRTTLAGKVEALHKMTGLDNAQLNLMIASMPETVSVEEANRSIEKFTAMMLDKAGQVKTVATSAELLGKQQVSAPVTKSTPEHGLPSELVRTKQALEAATRR